MSTREIFGVITFFGVPLALWLLSAMAARRLGRDHALLALISGADHRLSLSRLQMFIWTIVIFGAYAAATVASKDVTIEKWISIPAPILELAGIALSAGVVSTLIAATTGEDKSARVTGLAVDQAGPAPALVITGVDFGSEGNVRIGNDGLRVLEWTDKSKERQTNPTDPANVDTVKALLPAAPAGDALILDTGNGKICYKLVGTGPNLTLGPQDTCYEFADLFRNDKSPRGLDLTKFQMFGWTLVAVSIYVVMFLTSLDEITDTLPTVDETIALLTGISQGGYLVGKAVSS